MCPNLLHANICTRLLLCLLGLIRLRVVGRSCLLFVSACEGLTVPCLLPCPSVLTRNAPGPPSSLSNPPSNSRGNDCLSGYTWPTAQQRPSTVRTKAPICAAPLAGEIQVYSYGVNIPSMSWSSCTGSPKFLRSCLSHQSPWGSRNCRLMRGGLM